MLENRANTMGRSAENAPARFVLARTKTGTGSFSTDADPNVTPPDEADTVYLPLGPAQDQRSTIVQAVGVFCDSSNVPIALATGGTLTGYVWSYDEVSGLWFRARQTFNALSPWVMDNGTFYGASKLFYQITAVSNPSGGDRLKIYARCP